MTFKNLQNIEEALIGTINECRSKFSNTIIKLFESVKFDDDFNPINLVDYENYHGNKIAYFNAVQKLLESTKEFKKTTLFESEDFNNFKLELKNEIQDLIKIDDFKKLQKINPLVLQTKIFTKTKINVMGFDLNNFNKILKANKYNDCFAVLFCKSNKTLLFITTKFVFIYELKTGEINEIKPKIDLNRKNYIEIVNDNYSRNIQIIYIKFDEKEVKTELNDIDNIFGDKAIRNQYKKNFQKISKNSIVNN